MAEQEALYPIREISRLTGVTPITLRAWERRYNLIEPVRTESGHRLYTEDHINFVQNAVQLTKQGIPISKVKTILKERQQTANQLVEKHELDYLSELLNAARNFNISRVEELSQSLLVDYPEKQAFAVLAQVSLQLQEADLPAQTVWRSALLPILFQRIKHGKQALQSISARKALVLNVNHDDVLTALLANRAIDMAVVPFMLDDSTADADLSIMIQALHCETVMVFGRTNADYEYWLDWAKQSQSVEVILFGDYEVEQSIVPLNFKTLSLEKL